MSEKASKESQYSFTLPSSTYVAPFLRSDPIGESEPDLGCSFNSLYLLFIYLFFFKCRNSNPLPDSNGGSEPKLGLLDRFHLSYQKHLFMSFRFRVFNNIEAFHLP